MDFSSPYKIIIFAVKILFGVIDLGIFIYALLVLREVSIMNTSLKTSLGSTIGILAFLHFIVSALVVILLGIILLTA